MKLCYVDLIRGKQIAFLAGPFPNEEVARKYEHAAVDKAMELDPWAHFDPHGVVGVDAGLFNENGKLNHLIDIDQADLVPEAQRAAN